MSIWSQIIGSHERMNEIQAANPEPKPKTDVTHKTCYKCKQEKPRAEFYERRTHSPNALSSMCKECTLKRMAEKHKEKMEKK